MFGVAGISTRRRGGRLFALVALCAAGPVARGQTAEPLDQTAYVRVLDQAGKPAEGLTAADFMATLDGKSVEILQTSELDRSDSSLDIPSAGLRLVIYVDEDLSFREAFRAERALLDVATRIDFGKDSAAVYSNRALSGFTRDRKRLRRLIGFFGEEADRMGFGRAAPVQSGWKGNWPAALPVGGGEAVREIAIRGNQGGLTSVLTPLRSLTGWKILLYFGRDIPYRSNELEYHDSRFGARALSDAGFTVFAFNPSGRDDTGMGRLKKWAEGTGGQARAISDDLRPALREWLRDLSHVYLMTLADPHARDCRWSELKIEATRPGLRVLHGAGSFATRDAAVDLTQRTLWTVAAAPERFQDFPVELNAKIETTAMEPGTPPQPSAIRVAVRFPFAASRDQDTLTQSTRSGNFEQRIYFFIGVYDRGGRLLGRFEAPVLLSRERGSLEKSVRELARLDETILLDRFGTPASLHAILVVGQNRRIATRSLTLAPNDQSGAAGASPPAYAEKM